MKKNNENSKNLALLNKPFEKYYTNYFATDHVSRSSLVLQKAARQLSLSTNSWR